MIPFLALGYLTLVAAAFADILELNQNSSIFPSVYKVSHHVEDRTLAISFKRTERCRSPTFVVRISGESIYKMDLDGRRAGHFNFTYPPILDRGMHFIEVLILYCTAFDPENYYPKCVEDVHLGHNIVTMPYSFTVLSEATTGHQKRPRWVLSNHNNGTKSLPTMYQRRVKDSPVGAVCVPNYDKTHCNPEQSAVDQHRQYDWVDKPDWWTQMQSMLALVDKTAQVTHTGDVRASTGKFFIVCFVGDSHSRYLFQQSKYIPRTQEHFSFLYIQSHVPAQFNISSLEQHQCSVAVITYGQWLVSMQAGVPYTKTRYKREMSALMSQLSSSAYTGPTKIFMRSENYNGLGYYYTRCNPIDYRTIPVIDMLNSVQQELAEFYKLHYIDLTHIMGPMWDSAADFCHPEGKVFDAQLEWILFTIFDTYNKLGEPISMYSVSYDRMKLWLGYNATMATEASELMHANVVPHRGSRRHSH